MSTRIPDSAELAWYINLKLAALGQPAGKSAEDNDFLEIARPLLRNHQTRSHLLGEPLCPADARIQSFLDYYLGDVCPRGVPRLPGRTFVLDRPGLARLLSLPGKSASFSSPYLTSYRVPQGVLHNPRSDRRTTKGVFHIAEGGLPVPADKQAVPKQAFGALLKAALVPPAGALELPYTADEPNHASLFVSLLLRPLVCPAAGADPAKTMEIRFFAPGSLVSNLDFVESIFGNAGDPHLPENDAALDAMHWTGHTGCVILAPHIVGLKKIDLGLPHFNEATERQRRDGMCWEAEDEPYNEGNAFKICCRTHHGLIVTVIADNYYGYCKKEVKTQISFAANLYGTCEEEHAGGAMAFATYVLGQDFIADRTVSLKKASYEDGMKILGELADRQPEGYAIDRRFPDIYYLPADSVFSVRDGCVTWEHAGATHKLSLRPSSAYVLPSGFRVRIEKQMFGSAWRLIGSRPRGTVCHKPCTVSGGGKSEISKSIAGAVLHGPVFVRDYHRDLEQVAEIFKKDFSRIYEHRAPDARSRRPILSPERTLGSVIQLLTPSAEYREEHNDWIHQQSQTVRQLVFTIKRYYRPEWGEYWREHFTVDRINGFLGHELKFDNQPLVANYLRVGYDSEGSWRIYKLRPDFYPAEKIQMEDDITASVVLPRSALNDLDPEYGNPSVKLVSNCETLLFQRPDDAVHRGVDRQAEADIARPGTFLSNFEPLMPEHVRAIVNHAADFDRYSDPMRRLLEEFAPCAEEQYVVSSAHPRMVNGKPSQNPRYLQRRPDLEAPRETYLAEVVARLEREIPVDRPVHFPVNAVLGGRRNTLQDPAIGLPPLAVYGPIHYQELPELFMERISSLTGKSPATVGFGSEGALTKGPFNALWPIVDLNNALVSAILTQDAGFTTSAGFIGPNVRVDHDVSLLVPEIWCRMRVAERNPEFLIANQCLEKVMDFEWSGRFVQASRLGYRITALFVDRFLGRIFETPGAVFPREMLQPETQDPELFAAGVEAIVETQKRVALNYFEDGSVEAACPPLKALLHIMAYGSYNGLGVEHPAIRQLFERDVLLESDWYRERLHVKQARDIALWERHVAALEEHAATYGGAPVASRDSVDFQARLKDARIQLSRVRAPGYVQQLAGTIGADPFHCQLPIEEQVAATAGATV